ARARDHAEKVRSSCGYPPLGEGNVARPHPGENFRCRWDWIRFDADRPSAELLFVLPGSPTGLVLLLLRDKEELAVPLLPLLRTIILGVRFTPGNEPKLAIGKADIARRSLRKKAACRTRLAGHAQRAALGALQ